MYGNGTSSANPEHNNEPEQRFGTFLEIGSLCNVFLPGPVGCCLLSFISDPAFKACVLFVSL
jgi:hypothetical protein